MSEEIIYPVEKSLGGDNTTYVACEYRDRQQNYAICLNVIKAYDEKRRKSDDVCCSEIKKMICPALKMRQEELLAGHTLYYIPRKKVEVVAVVERVFVTPDHIKKTDSYQRGWNSAGSIINNKSEPAKVSPRRIEVKPVAKIEAVMDGSMASVVSQMAREHAAGVVEVKKEVVTRPETMLEKARRIREQRGAA